MIKLIIDTSGIYTSLGLVRDSELLSHSASRVQPLSYLHQNMKLMLEQFDLRFQDVSLIAVVIGPGSWTGLNIGLVAAKTLARTLNIPLLPLSTFEILAESQRIPSGKIKIAVDARQKRLYTANYPCDSSGKTQFSNGRFEVLSLEGFNNQLAAAPPDALISYRQSVSLKKDVLAQLDSPIPHQHHHVLPIQATVNLVLASHHQALDGDNLLNLMPNYMQLTSPERKRLNENSG